MKASVISLNNIVADFEDGIYSANFSPFNGSDNYTIDVKAKGEAGHATWNVEGLQPSGVLPDKISKFSAGFGISVCDIMYSTLP